MTFILEISALSFSKQFYQPLILSLIVFLHILIGNLNFTRDFLAFIEFKMAFYYNFST